MSYVNPAWVEYQRKRWLRHDAHLFMKPEPIQRKTYAERLVEQRQAEEATALAAEHEALREDLARLKWLVADLKLDLAIRRLRLKTGYNPGQPRRPKGDPQGAGEWVRVGGNEISTTASSAAEDRSAESGGQFLSDASPDPARPGAQYAQSRVEIDPRALTGTETIDRTTVALTKRLANVVDALELLPTPSGQAYGVLVHETLKLSLRLFPIAGVDIEPTLGGTGVYGSKGSARPDIRLTSEVGDTLAYYDWKTGNATVSSRYADKVRDTAGGAWIPVIQLSVTKGDTIKSRQHPHFDRWCDVR